MRTAPTPPAANFVTTASPVGKPSVKGWCPGALRPMLSGDGWVVRIRPPTGRLSAAQAAGIAQLAERHGNGLIDITSRANVQLRGVREASHAELIDGLRAFGLIDANAEVEARRNIVVTPFWRAGDGTLDIAAAQANALAQPDAPNLPKKFGFAVDTGAQPVLQDTSADIRIERTASGLFVRADGFATGARVTADEAVPAAMALARWYAASPRSGRMAALVGSQSLPDAFQTPLPPLVAVPQWQVGPNAHGWLVGIAFGQMSAQTLSALAECADINALRITPWRMVLIEAAHHVPEAPGLITRADDPLLQVVACSGAPQCQHATIDTRTVARALAPYLPADRLLHISGCTKGCAHPKAALTLVGTNDGIDLIRHGTAASTADRCALSADTVATELQRLLHATPI
ncbi:precorrin-3B synthase [Simplicispira psychrophila]|uniref:precorrin-3B synthase n=1 Tax=Simplicispira psychrophila TaxID=80882 RepID=UPI000A027A3E|nr:precorrin-3B synthase [Simplicispira psychrophila]